MELRHLRYFIRAAELQHFTRAAESLFVSQPTLSIHIQQLEEELGAELFARVGRQVRLTEAGELLLIRARQSVHSLETASEEIDAIKGLLRGSLSIASLPAHGSRTLPSFISAFTRKHPDVRLQVRSGATSDIEAGIISGAVDLGFSTLPCEHDEINTTELFDDKIVLIVSDKHPLANKTKLEPADLHQLPMALTSHRVAISRQRQEYFQALGVQPKQVVEFDDGNALMELAKLGDLATILPSAIIRADSHLRVLELPPPGVHAGLAALWIYLTPAAKAFLDVAKKESSSHRRNAEPA